MEYTLVARFNYIGQAPERSSTATNPANGGTSGSKVSPQSTLPFWPNACYGYWVLDCSRVPKELVSMEWTAPQHEEIDLNCEVSSYANAEL